MADRELQQELDALKEDMSRLRADLGDLVDALVDTGRQRATSARTRLETEARERLDELRQAMRRTRERGEQAVGSVQHRVEENPLLSVLVAFGIGLVLGKVLDRR